MNAKNKSFALPLTFIGIMFFAIGFALGINSLLVPVLQGPSASRWASTHCLYPFCKARWASRTPLPT